MKNIVILISGSGSNMLALVRAAEFGNWGGRFDARIAAVISNRPGSAGLQSAQARGVCTDVVDHRGFALTPDPRSAFDTALAKTIDRYEPSLLILAGFMRILTPNFVRHFAGRIVNIHPSLLPAFPGLDTHRRAIASGCRVAGATVHRVTEALDHGLILGQVAVPVLPGDSADDLAARVLTQEHLLYPRVIEELLQQSVPAQPR